MDYEDEDDIRRLAGLIERLSQRPSYQESDRSTKTVVIGVGITLLGAFVIGGWALSNQVAGLAATMVAVQRQADSNTTRIERLENRK